MRYVVLLATFLSLVWFPWPITVVLMVVSSMFVPLSGIVFGVLFDMVYAPVGAVSMPLGVLWGSAAIHAEGEKVMTDLWSDRAQWLFRVRRTAHGGQTSCSTLAPFLSSLVCRAGNSAPNRSAVLRARFHFLA